MTLEEANAKNNMIDCTQDTMEKVLATDREIKAVHLARNYHGSNSGKKLDRSKKLSLERDRPCEKDPERVMNLPNHSINLFNP